MFTSLNLFIVFCIVVLLLLVSVILENGRLRREINYLRDSYNFAIEKIDDLVETNCGLREELDLEAERRLEENEDA